MKGEFLQEIKNATLRWVKPFLCNYWYKLNISTYLLLKKISRIWEFLFCIFLYLDVKVSSRNLEYSSLESYGIGFLIESSIRIGHSQKYFRQENKNEIDLWNLNRSYTLVRALECSSFNQTGVGFGWIRVVCEIYETHQLCSIRIECTVVNLHVASLDVSVQDGQEIATIESSSSKLVTRVSFQNTKKSNWSQLVFFFLSFITRYTRSRKPGKVLEFKQPWKIMRFEKVMEFC